MAYNAYGYPNYPPYYSNQQPDQSQNQQSTSSTQAYQNPYSPYYQSTGQYAQQSSERGQQYQTKPGIENSNFQSNYYSQSQYQPTPGNDNSNAYSQAQSYLPTTQTSSNYAYSTQTSSDQNGRSYADNSALGNLAYASTLGRNSPAAGQSQSGNRQQSSLPAYQMVQNPAQYQQQQPISHDNTGQPQRTKTPSSYPTAREAVRQVQHNQPSPQLPTQTNYRSTNSVNSRPASAMSQRATQSPKITQKPRASQQHNSQTTTNTQKSAASTKSSTKAPRNSGKSSNVHQISTIMNQNEPTTTQQERPNVGQVAASAQGSFKQSSDQIITSPPRVNENQPTTIDPSQIFDHAEYQRRKKAAEEADAAKRTTKKTGTQSQQIQSQAQQNSQTAQSQSAQSEQPLPKHNRTDSQSREQIQAEMKAMIEKMREYKSRDPMGFTEIWEQFKKVQPPPPGRVSSQTPQTSKTPAPPGPISGNDAAIISPNADDPSFPSPVLGDAQAVLGESSGQLPDKGKFPAMRRKTRNDKGVSRPGKGVPVASTSQKEPQPVPASKPQTQPKTIPKGRALVADTGAESMRKAMQAFHNTPTPTPSSQQSSPPAQSPRPTIWPEEKKAKLAEVAKQFLEGLNPNKGKVITTTEIRMMLNQNPSYDQLCVMLSSRGFLFSRAPFAQTLLSVVPTTAPPAPTGETPKKSRGRPRKHDISPVPGGSGGKSDSAPSKDPSSNSKYNVRGQNNFTKVGAVEKKKPGSSGSPTNVISHGLPFLNGPSNVAPEYKNYYERMRMISSGSPPGPTQAVSKQQAARKRNFSEIVDLSQVSDGDENRLRKQKAPKVGGDHAGKEQALPPTLSSDLILTNPGSNQNEPDIHIDPNLEQSTEHSYTSTGDPTIDAQNGRLERFRADSGTTSKQEILRNANLVQPINTIEALRHRPINVSTIARDILISRGEHPHERPLNFHLRDLAMNFKSVTTKSDLSTFRWDLVDPGGPPPETMIPSIEGESDSEDAEDRASSLRNDQIEYNRIDAAAHSDLPKRFNSILARGRGRGRGRGRPRVRGAIFGSRFGGGENGAEPKTTSLKPSRGGSGLVSRGRVRVRGASRAVESFTPTAADKTPATFSKPQIETSDTRNLDAEQTNPGNNTSTVPLPLNNLVQANSMNIDSASDTQDEEMIEESPRRNLMIAASADVMQDPPKPIDQLPMRPSPKAVRISSQSLNPVLQAQKKKRGRPPKDRNSFASSSPSSTPIVTSQPTDVGSSQRKRGRPPGAKNKPKPGPSPMAQMPGVRTQTPVDGIKVVVSSPPASLKASPLAYVEPRQERSKQVWNAVNKDTDEELDTDQYTPFPCSWSSCAVKLHNLETLRKHVRNVHISQPPKSVEGGLYCCWTECGQNDVDFADMALLEEHVDEEHLTKIAASLGDGPSTHPAVVDPSVYLCDSTGKQVTPYARAVGRPDPLPLRAGTGPTKAYHKAHGNITQEQKRRAINESIRTHIERGELPSDAELVSSSEEDEDETEEEPEEEPGKESARELQSRPMLRRRFESDSSSAISDS